MLLRLAAIVLPPLCIACVVMFVAGVPWKISGRIAAGLLVFLLITGFCDRVRQGGIPWPQHAPAAAEPAAATAPAPPQPQETATGLGASAIAGLPVYKYKKKRRASGGGDECSICLGEIKPKETVKQLPVCTHLFHEGCIDVWLRAHRTCPVCRTPAVDAATVPPPVELVARN